jgi:hypothetical protein
MPLITCSLTPRPNDSLEKMVDGDGRVSEPKGYEHTVVPPIRNTNILEGFIRPED